MFIKSTISNENSWIKQALIEEHKFPCLSEKDYSKFEEWQKGFYDTRFRDIFNYATSEWTILSHDVEKDKSSNMIECQLCGKKHLKLISTIKNRKTDEQLIVGSSCIKDYDEMTDSLGKNAKQLRKEQNNETNTILRNEQLLEIKSKGILADVERFDKIRINDGIIIKTEIENRYNSLNCNMEKYKKYLKIQRLSDNKIDDIIKFHKDIKQFLSNYDKYVEISNNSLLGLNKDVSKWCKINCDYTTLDRLKTVGEIDKQTINSIGEVGFLQKIIPLFNNLLKSNKINLTNKGIGIMFEIQFEDIPNINVNIQTRDFIEDYSDYIFEKINISIDKSKLKKNCTITNKKSLENSLFLICNRDFENRHYKIIFYDIQLNELAFQHSKVIKVVDYKKFINGFKRLALDKNCTSNDIAQLITYIDNNCQEYSYGSYKEHLRNFDIKLK